MDVQPQGVHAPGIDEEHIEPEILPVASLLGPRTHNLLHDPLMPWCDICTGKRQRRLPHTGEIKSASSDPIRLRSFWYTPRRTTLRPYGFKSTWAQEELGRQLC